jgi:hypothetical protein
MTVLNQYNSIDKSALNTDDSRSSINLERQAMARTPDPDTKSGKTTLNLSRECKALLIELSEEEESPMSKTLHRALLFYKKHKKSEETLIEAGLEAFKLKGEKKGKSKASTKP